MGKKKCTSDHKIIKVTNLQFSCHSPRWPFNRAHLNLYRFRSIFETSWCDPASLFSFGTLNSIFVVRFTTSACFYFNSFSSFTVQVLLYYLQVSDNIELLVYIFVFYCIFLSFVIYQLFI